ncbi:MAG: TusE/DsrC/DsvC family sulfur relay protein [Gammaproteobacteria bacterium]|nr:TusE/DsrC/DsvC family sulfur relay protein [Gammaproteobacteria bacterium]MYF54008.1 TusE/DsrC/DsvC family sulfur relay protein [Gammaproteobacteria bacterium]MYK43933.1 TusE/DsrC/DsvC family sulfur relay protein [Gammaproteobacteria bacterium]
MIEVDDEGFLADPRSWTIDYAKSVAAELNVNLTDEHWLIIHAVRDFYTKTGMSPSMRPLMKIVQTKAPNLANSIKLSELFTNQTTRVIAQISGLPKPTDCI